MSVEFCDSVKKVTDSSDVTEITSILKLGSRKLGLQGQSVRNRTRRLAYPGFFFHSQQYRGFVNEILCTDSEKNKGTRLLTVLLLHPLGLCNITMSY